MKLHPSFFVTDVFLDSLPECVDKEQLTITGIIISAIGAILLFGIWMEVRYYDYYGPVYISLNGIDVLSSGTNSFIILFVPLIVTIIFLVMIIQYYKVQKGIKRSTIIACIAIFFIVWLYNIAVSGHIEDKYFDESMTPATQAI